MGFKELSAIIKLAFAISMCPKLRFSPHLRFFPKTPYGNNSVEILKVYIAEIIYLSFKELSASILAFAMIPFFFMRNKLTFNKDKLMDLW